MRKSFEVRFSVRFHGNLFLDRLKMTSLEFRVDQCRREANPTLISKMKCIFLRTTLNQGPKDFKSRLDRGRMGSNLICKRSISLFAIAICKIVLDIFRNHLRIFVLLPILTDKYMKIPMTESVPHLYLKFKCSSKVKGHSGTLNF